MVGSLLLRGMLAGLLAGFLAFGFATIFGEPQLDRAIAFEAQQAQAAGEAAEPEYVSREIQSSIGLLTDVLVYGAGLGGLFALCFACVYGRAGRLDARMTAALLALSGFVAIILVPFLKYPANPPSIGMTQTIGYRTGLYFLMIVISLITLIAVVLLGRRLAINHGIWRAVLIAAGSFVAIIAVAGIVLPDINEVPASFPAVVLWRFRMASLGIHIVLWTSLGLVFGALADGALGNKKARGKRVLFSSGVARH